MNQRICRLVLVDIIFVCDVVLREEGRRGEKTRQFVSTSMCVHVQFVTSVFTLLHLVMVDNEIFWFDMPYLPVPLTDEHHTSALLTMLVYDQQ